MRHGPQWFAALTLAYCVALIPLLTPDPWMWRVWLPAWAVFTVPAGWYTWRGGTWQRALVPWVGGVAFSIVAVLAAVMETRVYDDVGAIFWALGAGMAGSVILFLMSYDRSKRAPAEAE